MGASAGLIPCPSALVVLLGAVAQHQVALGLALIVAFSVGLAATLTALGLLVVHARRLTTRLRVPQRLATALPAASAVLIVGLGCLLTLQAAPSCCSRSVRRAAVRTAGARTARPRSAGLIARRRSSRTP